MEALDLLWWDHSLFAIMTGGGDTRCERLRSADVEDMFTMEVNGGYCTDWIVFEEVLFAQGIKEMRPPATA